MGAGRQPGIALGTGADGLAPMPEGETDQYAPHTEAGGTRFIDRLREAIAADTLGGSKRFAQQTGLSPGYLSEILKGSKLPALDRMERSLGTLPAEERTALLLLLSRDKVLADPEAKPFVDLLTDFIELARAHGVPIPGALEPMLHPGGIPTGRTTRRLARTRQG